MANIQVLKTQWEYGVRQFSEDLISVELASCRLDKRRIIWHLTLVYFDHVGINFKLVHAFLGWTMPQVTTSSYHWVTPASHLASQSVKLACELASQSVSQSVSRSVGQSVGQSVSQSVSQPVSYWVSRSADPLVSWLFGQTVSHSASQPAISSVIHQSVSEYIGYSASRSVGHLVVGVSVSLLITKL